MILSFLGHATDYLTSKVFMGQKKVLRIMPTKPTYLTQIDELKIMPVF